MDFIPTAIPSIDYRVLSIFQLVLYFGFGWYFGFQSTKIKVLLIRVQVAERNGVHYTTSHVGTGDDWGPCQGMINEHQRMLILDCKFDNTFIQIIYLTELRNKQYQ